MLQQMFSPHYRVGEVTSLVSPSEACLTDDDSSSDAADCTIRRNYSCTKCIFNTSNPRVYLVHIRDVHFENFKIYDCQHCMYASRYQQKLTRHVKMIHTPISAASIQIDMEEHNQLTNVATSLEPTERIEDMLEEVEECDDDLDLDVDEYIITDPASAEAEKTANKTPKTFNKDSYFSCSKCNYVTHIKARYTKHVKYHSMPMIKCTICDFRSPYKWNLDRHMKNHGGSGSFKCFTCNFTADIKQSLTLHEVNHHTPSVGQSVPSRRRNRVGASDMADALIQKEEEGSGDSRSSMSEMGLSNAEKDIVSCHSDSNDADASDNGIKKETVPSPPEMQSQFSPNNSMDDSKTQKQNRKPPRPLPPLIPLHVSTPNQNKTITGEPPCKKFKDTSNSEVIESSKVNAYDHLPIDISIVPVNTSHSKELGTRKKNESFFDKLKERLLTETGEEGSLKCKNCGFESKCLSEHSVHEKNCTSQLNRTASNTLHPNLSSTRCQNCRHRCKSSADLYIHLQTCQKSDKVDDDALSTNIKNVDKIKEGSIIEEKESEPHPMENVVFVWNNITHNENKYNTPLDININDDCTMPDINRSYEIDTPDDNDSMNLSPSQAIGKKVFKCPHCPFWASTASRFHVHIVGHLNKKPFECSLCKYKSNWRWDITKHIKLKSARDPEHNNAKVLMTDETGRRNYSKYNQFLAMSVLNEKGENVFHYLDLSVSADSMMEIDEHLSVNDTNDNVNHTTEMQPLNLQTHNIEQKYGRMDFRIMDIKKPKRTLWKCKKCNYRDPSKEALLEHVREHAKTDPNQDESKSKKSESPPDPADLAYRCGHCNQLSNWKHVIQRHCRLKHNGIIKVITTVKPKPDLSIFMNDISGDSCTKCPFRSPDKKLLLAHVQQHQPSAQSIFKCFFCPFFVKDENELIQHLLLHGITEPEEYIANAIGRKSPLAEVNTHSTSNKRHKCTECPYETNSKSQYMYHEQFHRLPADTPYKCPECNYSVSKRHLLHQHLRVHGIISKKFESEAESEIKSDPKIELSINLDEIPFVWVSAKNEFHKMYKCRYCSYVNSQKCKIPNHEKIHCIAVENSEVTVFKCLECKFTCDNAFRLAEHSKTHGEIYGRIYCPVENDIPDEEQIAKLRKVIESEKPSFTDDSVKDEKVATEKNEIKILYFCQMCPSRFLCGDELRAHDKFHDLSYANTCNQCQFSVPTEDDLNDHVVIHSDEYHTKTKMLKFMHNSHASHTQPKLELVHCPSTSEISWIVSNPCKNYDFESNLNRKPTETKQTPKQYLCKECPAKFFKSSALNYHAALHGGEGDHKCKKCSYTVKNVGNLAKHELLHENEGKPCDYESGDDMDYKNIPLSGTDLFQRKTEAQKRVLNDKDKLVKPNDHFPPVLQADPQFGYLMHGNPEFIYPTYLKNGRQKEKRYKCHKCPSAFEKREQYKIHLSLHGSKQRYKCELCDYSVKYYANYVQHMRKHQMNDEAHAERKKNSSGIVDLDSPEIKQEEHGNIKLAIKTMPKGVPKSDFQQFSVRDQQTLRLLQRRRSLNNNKDQTSPTEPPAKERKMHMCLLCPYTNQRQDALNNHYRRHDDTDVLNTGSHKCSYCDLVVLQSHFLREHLKTHFSYQKNLAAECYIANEDVSFTMTNDDEDEASCDLKLQIDIKNEDIKCNENKIFVKIQTGELVIE